jgi:hypothetical protein
MVPGFPPGCEDGPVYDAPAAVPRAAALGHFNALDGEFAAVVAGAAGGGEVVVGADDVEVAGVVVVVVAGEDPHPARARAPARSDPKSAAFILTLRCVMRSLSFAGI